LRLNLFKLIYFDDSEDIISGVLENKMI